MTARTLAQVDARLTTEITTRAAQLKGTTASALLDRINALEDQFTEAQLIALKALAAGQAGGVVAGGGGTPLPPPAPPDIPPPTPPGYPSQVASGPLVFDHNGQTIENYVIDSFPGSAMDIGHQVGLAGPTYSIRGQGYSGCILRNVTLRGRQWGALLIDMEEIQLIDVTVLDVNYAAFGVFGGSGDIIRPIWKKVAMLRGTGGYAAGYPSFGDKGNAYGVKFERANASGEPGASATIPHDWSITDFLGEDVRSWQGINAHQVNHLLIDTGKLYRTPRGGYFSGEVADVTMKNVEFIDPQTQAGGTSDLTAISFGNLQGGLFDANLIDARYANRVTNIDFYSGGHSTGVVVGSNPVHTYP